MKESAGTKEGNVRHWLERLLTSRHSPLAMGGLSFLESTVLAVPLELILVPYMLANRHRIWWIAALVTLGCLLGALCGYLVGMAAYGTLGSWIIERFGWQQAAATFQMEFNQNGFLAVLLVGVSPVPFQIAMLTAGASGYSVPLFLLAAALARGLRYFGLALLVVIFGRRVEGLLQRWRIRKRTLLLGMMLLALAITLFLVLSG